MGCRSRGRMIRRSGCSRADLRCRHRRCRSLSVVCSAIAGPNKPTPTTWTSSPTPTGSCVCPRLPASPPPPTGSNELLAAAYGDRWSPSLSPRLLADTGSKKKTLADWLRDDFFKQHCALFEQRPFIWHIWDGRPRRLRRPGQLPPPGPQDSRTAHLHLPRHDWVERQRADIRNDVAGADARLAAALDLQKQLETDPGRRDRLRHLRPLEAASRAADRLGSRPQRRRPAQHPTLHQGRRCCAPR